MNARELGEYVKRLARQAGFEACGIAAAEPIGRTDYVREWLHAGRAGSMDYCQRNLDKRLDPRMLLPGARSIIVVAQVYHQPWPTLPEGNGARGRVAMYAWGEDYHHVIKAKLHAIADRMRSDIGTPFETKACVDTVPIIEREFAAAAGIGWIGKNTLVLSEKLGSYTFLGLLITTLDIATDTPATDHCGSCTACLDACPTRAFPQAYQMDASRCISYLTIEHRGDISRPFQELIGDWVFGCDECQMVCPFNRDAPVAREPAFVTQRRSPRVDLDEIENWTSKDYRTCVRDSAMSRATLTMLKRNAAIARNNRRGRLNC